METLKAPATLAAPLLALDNSTREMAATLRTPPRDRHPRISCVPSTLAKSAVASSDRFTALNLARRWLLSVDLRRSRIAIAVTRPVRM